MLYDIYIYVLCFTVFDNAVQDCSNACTRTEGGRGRGERGGGGGEAQDGEWLRPGTSTTWTRRQELEQGQLHNRNQRPPLHLHGRDDRILNKFSFAKETKDHRLIHSQKSSQVGKCSVTLLITLEKLRCWYHVDVIRAPILASLCPPPDHRANILRKGFWF